MRASRANREVMTDEEEVDDEAAGALTARCVQLAAGVAGPAFGVMARRLLHTDGTSG